MHELGIVFHIIRTVEDVAKQNDVMRIRRVTLQLGEVSGVVESYLQDCWKWAAAKTDLLPGAVLTVDFPPELLARFDSGQRYGLLSALAADPRPRYQDDPDRVYGMAYAGKNVRFTVQDGTVRVVGVE